MRSVGGFGSHGKNDGEHANPSYGCFASGVMNKVKVEIAWSTYISADRGLDMMLLANSPKEELSREK